MSPNSKRPVVVDLFSGAGGFSLGFATAGCYIHTAVDADASASRSFGLNIARAQGQPPRVFGGAEGDIQKLQLRDLFGPGEVDILIGGPPCQSFSRAGRGKLMDLARNEHDEPDENAILGDPRSDLYKQFLSAASLWRPRAIVMENVPGMLSVQGRNFATLIAAEMAGLGYNVGYAVLNAAWYGVPQFRERLIFIGLRSDLGLEPRMPGASHRAALPIGYIPPAEQQQLGFPFADQPAWEELAVQLGSARLPAVTVSQALGDLPPLLALEGQGRPQTQPEAGLDYPGPPPDRWTALMRFWPGLSPSQKLTRHVIKQTPRDFPTFQRMKPGDEYPEALAIAQARFEEHLEELKRAGHPAPPQDSAAWHELKGRFVPPYRSDIFRTKWRKLYPDQPSWTVPAHLARDTYSHIHYDSAQARAISVREAARLQSFPDAFEFQGNTGDCFRQIGNAVPPLMAWAIAQEVMTCLGFEVSHTTTELLSPTAHLKNTQRHATCHSGM